VVTTRNIPVSEDHVFRLRDFAGYTGGRKRNWQEDMGKAMGMRELRASGKNRQTVVKTGN
jgi:hypothetical protein